MATVVFFHAHPDDEAIATGGTMIELAESGHSVVLVLATRGEVGEVADGFLDDGESLAERRVSEVRAAADILGVAKVEYLGYQDSGMMGEPTNGAAGAFWAADVDEAAERLAAILRRESADVLVAYDEIGGYGHPDHIQVHRVGMRAAERAGVRDVLQSTINRDRALASIAEAMEQADEGAAADPPQIDETTFGMPEARITTAVDVSRWVDRKRAAMRAHASQIPEDSWFLSMPDEAFVRTFGTEWFIRVGVPTPVTEMETSLLA